jgi:hypothetical protein
MHPPPSLSWYRVVIPPGPTTSRAVSCKLTPSQEASCSSLEPQHNEPNSPHSNKMTLPCSTPQSTTDIVHYFLACHLKFLPPWGLLISLELASRSFTRHCHNSKVEDLCLATFKVTTKAWPLPRLQSMMMQSPVQFAPMSLGPEPILGP